MDYKKRTIYKHLDFMLQSSGAILIEGPKWYGKKTTSKRFANSIIIMDDPKNRETNINLN